MDFQTIYVARSLAEYQNEVDFEIEETGDSEQEVIDLLAIRMATEDWLYVNGITVGRYKVTSIDGEVFRSDVHEYKVVSASAVKDLPSYIAAKKVKDAELKAVEDAKRNSAEAKLKAERLKIYEEVKRELEGK